MPMDSHESELEEDDGAEADDDSDTDAPVKNAKQTAKAIQNLQKLILEEQVGHLKLPKPSYVFTIAIAIVNTIAIPNILKFRTSPKASVSDAVAAAAAAAQGGGGVTGSATATGTVNHIIVIHSTASLSASVSFTTIILSAGITGTAVTEIECWCCGRTCTTPPSSQSLLEQPVFVASFQPEWMLP